MSALLIEKNGPVVTLTINRPESRNPLGEEGDGELFANAAAGINADRDVRCVILTGAGKAFSAGGNLKSMRERAGTFAGSGVLIRERYRSGIHRMVRALWNIEVPMIAAINGPAIGLGNDVACLADMRIAADSAVFGATFLKVGLVPGDGGAWILPRTIGLRAQPSCSSPAIRSTRRPRCRGGSYRRSCRPINCSTKRVHSRRAFAASRRMCCA